VKQNDLSIKENVEQFFWSKCENWL
jgi:hypothetical protein